MIEEKIKILLLVSQIESGKRVQKKKGDFWYTLRREIKIGEQVIKAGTGTAFIVQPDGNVGTIAGNEEMVVEFTFEEAEEFITNNEA